jgi:2-dehydropantoate 2-reductase
MAGKFDLKICVVGPGALGCLIAAFLSKLAGEIWLLDHRAQRAEKIGRQGIKIEGVSGKWQANPKVTASAADIGACDLVILSVKSYDTKKAVDSIGPLIQEDTSVLSLQNGIGNLEIIAESVGEKKVIGGVTSQGATLLGDGAIRHAGQGETVIGKMDGKLTTRLRQIRELFNKAGLLARISKDINSLIWSKLIINVGINALTAITRLNNGRLIEFNGTRQILRQAVSEAVRIAKRRRIRLIYDDPIQKVEAVCQATAGNISSMLQDVLKKKRTEIDFINGAITRLGQSLNVPTPVNSVLVDLVKTIEESYNLRLGQ